MKMKMKLHTLFSIAVIIAAGLLCSCNQEPLPSYGDNDQVLMLSPSLLGLQDGNIKTRAISDNDLKDNLYNESTVSRLDVFFFKTDGTFVKAYHLSGLTPSSIVHHGGVEGYLLSNNWINDGLVKGVSYKVYVVANSSNEAITSATSTSEASLKALSTTDKNIYKLYKEGVSDKTYSSDKTFLMNATVDSWTIGDQGTQLIGGDTVILERAAVKLVMDVSLSETLQQRLTEDNKSYGTPNWKFINFNTVTAELPEGTVPDEQLLDSPGGSSSYLDVVPGTEDGHFIVTTYAYPQSWTAETANDEAPAILVSYPAYDGGSLVPQYHYYYIPLCDPNVTTSTVRNKMYKVNAVISSYGSFETLTNDPVTLTYEVKDWVSATADVNAYATDYILATPSRYSFKGGEGPLSEVIKYYASGNVTISDIKAYYINNSGSQVPVTEGYTVGAPTNGQIEITSTVPTNGTYRTVEFTVNCGDKSQVVIFRHYPADFVAGISSSWCSYDDDKWAALGQSGKTYRGSAQQNGRLRYSTSNSTFSATMFENGRAYYLTTNGTRGDQKSSSVNNQMYVLQITAANDDYSIGKPNLVPHTARVDNSNGSEERTVTYYTSTDNVLSPAFMLASQLTRMNGYFSDTDFTVSAVHCALYKEVDSKGNVYTGWRLPTMQEIQYMIDNQKTNTEAMIEVLTGRYYYTLDGQFATVPNNTGGNYHYVRCVRDVTPEEIAKLNQF